MIFNRQHQHKVDLGALRAFLELVQAALKISNREINVCIMNDAGIRRLNKEFRNKPSSTDVLSFPWKEDNWGNRGRIRGTGFPCDGQGGEFRCFLGDVAISAETAARNARTEGHAVQQEICWLILHGALHLVGYDHETDHGQMVRLELKLRDKLGVGGSARSGKHRRNARRR